MGMRRSKQNARTVPDPTSMVPNVRWERFLRFHSPSNPFRRDFNGKSEILSDFETQCSSKKCENNAFNASDYHQISFRGVEQVHSYPTKCLVSLESTWILFYWPKRTERAIFSFFEGILMKMAPKASKIPSEKTKAYDLGGMKKFWKSLMISK